MMTADEILDALGHCIGTTQYYKHSLSSIMYTEGIQLMAELCEAYWLIDAVCSYQLNDAIAKQHFQIWRLEKTDLNWRLTMREDDGFPNLVSQTIEYSSFPLKTFEFYLIDGVILLKSEY